MAARCNSSKALHRCFRFVELSCDVSFCTFHLFPSIAIFLDFSVVAPLGRSQSCVYSYKNRSRYGWDSESPMSNISSKPLRVDCLILALQTLSEHNLLFLPQEKEIIVVERTGGSYQAPRTGIVSNPRSRRRRQPRTPRGALKQKVMVLRAVNRIGEILQDKWLN